MIEAKVQASTAAAAASGLALWSLGHWVFRGAVPDVVASWVYAAVPGILAFTAGYLARHTPRADTSQPVITVNAAAASSAELGRQFAAAVKASQRGGGHMAVGTEAPATMPPAPPSPLTGTPEPPAPAVTQPPAVAGDPGTTP